MGTRGRETQDIFLIYLFIYLFSHLADAFVQSDLQMRAIEAMGNTGPTSALQIHFRLLRIQKGPNHAAAILMVELIIQNHKVFDPQQLTNHLWNTQK